MRRSVGVLAAVIIVGGLLFPGLASHPSAAFSYSKLVLHELNVPLAVGQVQASPRQTQDNDIRFERLTEENGLSVSVVYDIAQDPQGFLWFATEDGLDRYDGREFKIFKHTPDDPDSLSYNWIYVVYVDRNGDLWAGTNGGGLNHFNPRTGQFKIYRNNPKDPDSLVSDVILALKEDAAGNLWVGTDKGLVQFNREQEKFTRFQSSAVPEDVRKAAVQSILTDSIGRMWVGTQNGLICLDPAGAITVYRAEPDDRQRLSYDHISVVVEDRLGQIWVGTKGGGLNRLDPVSGVFERFKNDPEDPYSLSHDVVTAAYVDDSGILWVGVWGGGLNRFDTATRHFTHYVNEPANPNSLGSNFIRTIYGDRSGSIWVSTWGAGLARFDRMSEQFIHYRSRPDDPNSLSTGMVWSILADGETLWVGTQNGLERIDRTSGKVVRYHRVGNHSDTGPVLEMAAIDVIYKDADDKLWLGSTKDGLARLDPESNEITYYRNDKNDLNSLTNNTVLTIAGDAAGQLWIGTGKGLDRLDFKTGRFTHFVSQPEDPNTLSANRIQSLLFSQDGWLWIGTEKGLNRYDPRSGRFTRNPILLSEPVQFIDGLITSITEDRQGRLWIGTVGGGANCYEPSSGEICVFREREGLPNDTVYSILEDNDGDLWMSTNKGLARYDPQTTSFEVFDVRDGIQSNEFNSNAFYKSADGELFFGGINGVTAFYPEYVRRNEYAPPVTLVSLTQNGQPAGALPPELLEAISFGWPNNSFEFEIAALSYVQPDQNQYAYMLEGFDRSWNEIGTNRTGRYTNLPGGSYTLRLKAANNDGLWNESGTAIHVQVIPAMWQTWWFRGVLALAVILLSVAGVRYRVNSIQKRNRHLEEQVEERTHEIERRRQELEALYHADEALYRNLNLDQVLQALVDSALQLLFADKGALLAWDEERRKLTARVTRGHGPETIRRMNFGPDEGIAGYVGVSGSPVRVENVADDKRVSRSITDPEGIQAFLQVPIMVEGQIFGVFSADFLEPRIITDNEMRLLTSLAQRAAVAIQNAQLYEHTQEQAVADERNRLARELHDAVTQTLFSASLLAEALPTAWENDPRKGKELLGELRQLSRGALAEMRTLLMELRPSALAEADLGDLLKQLGEAAAGREGIPVNVQLDGRCELPTDVHIALYRIAQEALNNALKHARADQIYLHLRRLDGAVASEPAPKPGVVLTVRDNGRGFDPERLAPNHFGLGIMRERADAIDATITIESQPGCGTQVTVLWEAGNSSKEA